MTVLSRSAFEKRFGRRAIFGMVHLHPLPGSPMFETMSSVLDRALRDAKAIVKGGAAGIVIENFGDRPFYKTAPVETVAAMTRVIAEIALETKLPIGVNVLRNDGLSALAIAAAIGASFIRVNVMTGAMVTDQGIIESEAAAILRKRRELGLDAAIFADHMVKHSTPLSPGDEEQSAKDLRFRSCADAIVVSGKETGDAADISRIEMLRKVTDAPLVIGSGLTAENASNYASLVDAAIVGTSIKKDGRLDAHVDADRMAAIVEAFSK